LHFKNRERQPLIDREIAGSLAKMKSAGIVTLFSELPPPRKAPSAFFISFVVHGVVFAWLLIGLRHLPRVNDQPIHERYTVRILEPPRLQYPRPPTEVADQAQAAAAPSATHNVASSQGGGSPAPLSLPVQEAHLPQRSQALIQPDAPPDLLLPKETPIPLAVLWSPENSPSKTIVPPPQQEPTVAKTQPAIIKPNREAKLSDLNISTTKMPAQTPMMTAGTTSPVVVRGPEPVSQVPSTSSATRPEAPTPARVVSLSPLQADGPVVIPLANQPAQGNNTNKLAPQRAEAATGNGGGNPASTQRGIGSGDGAGNAKAGVTAGPGGVPLGSVTVGPDSGEAGGSGHGTPSLVHLTLPKDGQFGVVVVGTSVTDQYPEVAEIWGGRLVYTVYLHVGARKNWVLQYSIPRAADAAVAGNSAKPEAPWPFDVLRPHLAPEDYNSDALIVHGFINLAGRFEKLAMVFPTGFAQAKFVINALQQWQFRPARQNGQIAAVEVLLIIPEEPAE
jgi:hypothetical protein